MPQSSIMFVVNGDERSAMGIRARSFAAWISGDFRINIAHRAPNKIYAIAQFLRHLFQARPALCYVFDMSFSGVLAAGIYRSLSRCQVVVDTGDAIYELSKNSGNRGRLGLWLTRQLERYSFAISDRVVVRSHPHQELLAAQKIPSDVIPDAVDTREFFPRAEDDLRRQHALHGFTVIGLVGSLIWNQRWQMCYGVELIEAMERLKHLPVKGLIVGDGSGLSHLKAMCSARGLAQRIVFAGRVPYETLPRYLNAMDICLSTQTNDTAGQVRTTGKLPLYLACGRFVLASEVGEAARVLPAEMLVTYNGIRDPEYAARLAARVEALLQHPESLRHPEASVAIAKENFDYQVLAVRMRQTLNELLHRPVIAQAETVVPSSLGRADGSKT